MHNNNDAESLKERIRYEMTGLSPRLSYWIEKDLMIQGLKIGILKLQKANESQGDGTFKTTAVFEGRVLVYVGEQIQIT